MFAVSEPSTILPVDMITARFICDEPLPAKLAFVTEINVAWSYLIGTSLRKFVSTSFFPG